MSLISLLIALAAERSLSSPVWQFNTVFTHYIQLFRNFGVNDKVDNSQVSSLLLLVLPVVLTYVLLSLIGDGILNLVFSTIILIVCFGCLGTRDCYKNYLKSAYLGETTTCNLHYEQLIADKNLPDVGFGQTLIWLNYRYYIAVMLFFVLFGAPGAVFYRLVCVLDEKQRICLEKKSAEQNADLNSETEGSFTETDYSTLLFWLDWLPVRIATFGFVLVGHFSRAISSWFENVFDVHKMPQEVLIGVAVKSEDFMIDPEDCTAEPCLLVRLAKRNVLLLLAAVSVFTLMGIIS